MLRLLIRPQLFCGEKRHITLASGVFSNFEKVILRKTMEELDLLQNYEIKAWDINPRFYKIIGASAVINVLIFAVLGNTNLLSSRACDSPFVSKVCQVLDTVYVGARLFSGEKDYVVKDYAKTKIDDSEVVWIDQTGVGPKFDYPEGYFQIANPVAAEDEFAMNPENSFDTIPSTPDPGFSNPLPPISNNDSGLLASRPKLPKRNRRPAKGNLPDSPFGIADDKDNKDDKLKNDSPSTLPGSDAATAKNDKNDKNTKPEKNPLEENTAVKSDPVKGIDINRKPLDDLADEALAKYLSKEVDFSQQFLIKMTGEITKNGRLNRDKSKFAKAQGNEQIVNLAKRAIESVGDSGWLGYLSDVDLKQLDLTLAQNDLQFVAVVVSKASSSERAKSVSSILRNAISARKLAHTSGLSKLEDDELALLNAAKITSEGNLVKINFNLPKPIAQKMIDDRLREYQAKKLKEKQGTPPKAEAKPNGTADKTGKDKNAAK